MSAKNYPPNDRTVANPFASKSQAVAEAGEDKEGGDGDSDSSPPPSTAAASSATHPSAALSNPRRDKNGSKVPTEEPHRSEVAAEIQQGLASGATGMTLLPPAPEVHNVEEPHLDSTSIKIQQPAGAFRLPGPGAGPIEDAIDLSTAATQPDIENSAPPTPQPRDGEEATIYSAHVVGENRGGGIDQRLRDRLRGMAANAPLVEGVKAAPPDEDGSNQSKGGSGRRKWILAAAVMIVVVITGSIIGGVFASRGQDSDDVAPPEPDSTSLVPLSTRILNITESISNPGTFDNSSTPQTTARDWLLYNDSYSFSSSLTNDEIGQRYILALLYFALGGQGWTNSQGFLGETNVCSGWFGVKCKPHPSNPGIMVVSKILLEENGLSGMLPEEITHLSMLEVLDLGGGYETYLENLDGFQVKRWRSLGKIVATIPSNIGALARLKELSLAFNMISGTLPAGIGSLTDLETLHLENNLFTGTIPSSIGNLVKLEALSLWSDQWPYVLTGTIPSTIGNLQSLKWMNLALNDLTGSIPSEIGQLENLEHLNVERNGIGGSLPFEIGNLERLQQLNLGSTNLGGSLPSEIGRLKALEQLDLGFNAISGAIPSELGNLSRLGVFNMFGNELSGSIPSSVGNLMLGIPIGLEMDFVMAVSMAPQSVGGTVGTVR